MVNRVIQHLRRRFRFINEFLPPSLLIKNNVELSDKELAHAIAAGQIEREWYRPVKPFKSTAQIREAAEKGRLVKVEPSTNYLPIMRFRNPELNDKYPPYITPEAKQLLNDLTAEWRKRASAAGVDKNIRLSLTSFVRTEDYQKILIAQRKVAQPESPHLRGEAFDIDASGYYLEETPVNARKQQHAQYRAAFAKLGAVQNAPEYADYSLYNERVHKILKELLDEWQASGRLHYLHEYPGTQFAAFHVCRNPEYEEDHRR